MNNFHSCHMQLHLENNDNKNNSKRQVNEWQKFTFNGNLFSIAKN